MRIPRHDCTGTLAPALQVQVWGCLLLSRERVELSALAFLTAHGVLSDVFYPGWTAAIDDRPAQVYPANFAFRAALVSPGEHRVTFTFESVAWRVGLAISALTIVGLLGYVIWRWRRRKRS